MPSRDHANSEYVRYYMQTIRVQSLSVTNTRRSADADKPARRLQKSVKVTKHSTIPYVRCSFLWVCNSNFVFKTRRFSDIRLRKCRDHEIRVKGHSRSL